MSAEQQDVVLVDVTYEVTAKRHFWSRRKVVRTERAWFAVSVNDDGSLSVVRTLTFDTGSDA